MSPFRQSATTTHLDTDSDRTFPGSPPTSVCLADEGESPHCLGDTNGGEGSFRKVGRRAITAACADSYSPPSTVRCWIAWRSCSPVTRWIVAYSTVRPSIGPPSSADTNAEI